MLYLIASLISVFGALSGIFINNLFISINKKNDLKNKIYDKRLEAYQEIYSKLVALKISINSLPYNNFDLLKSSCETQYTLAYNYLLEHEIYFTAFFTFHTKQLLSTLQLLSDSDSISSIITVDDLMDDFDKCLNIIKEDIGLDDIENIKRIKKESRKNMF